ncbi:MAG: hypothetical protein HY720_15350 [Planctomycetes bacterium]|nr:hypothetical protein [Planctomycetota bacterium]
MKTTIELPEGLYRQLKAHAALSGHSLKALFEQALREKLQRESGGETSGWRSAFGKVPRTALSMLDQAIDREFEQIDPGAWQ